MSERDILALALEAVRDGLISQNVLKHVTSLHPQVPTSLKCRYLLSCFHASLRKFICLPEKYKKYDIKEEFRFADECLLDLKQHSYLYESLVSYAHKWRDIGIALRFQPQDLDNIQACLHLINESPKSYLRKLLENWLVNKLSYVLSPTEANLKCALSSKTVGLGTMADKFHFNSNFIGHSLPYSVITVSLQKELAAGDTTSIVDSQHHVTSVVQLEENDSTLLGIELKLSGFTKQDVFEYTWTVDKESSKKYSGLDSSCLCITSADTDMDCDEIFCEIRHFSRLERTPEAKVICRLHPISLNVDCPLDKFKNNLASMYLAQPELPEDTWPPVGNKKYINLALVKRDTGIYCSNYVNIENTLKHKQMIEYEEVLGSLKSKEVLLIEGRPGSGKTTLVHNLTHDWATSASKGVIRILLLISLRVLNAVTNPDLSDILKLFKDLKVSQELIEERAGKGVCFIFDGLDEFSPDSRQNSVVYKIINKTYLSQSTVIVASRPVATSWLRLRAKRVIEVLGFTNDKILEFFNHYPFSSHGKLAKLRAYLSAHPNVFNMCYLPIHAAMIAFLFEVTENVPKTETELYAHFTRFTLMRNLSKNKEIELDRIDNHSLTELENQCFKSVCKLAFDSTLSNKQVLNQDNFRSYFESTQKSSGISLGLISIDRIAGLYGYENVYTFLHPTFQEYLAACHISTLSDQKQLDLIQEHGGKDHMSVLWKFFCGLVKIRAYETKFKSLLQNSKGNILFQIQCAYECQQKIPCAQLLKALQYHILLSDKCLCTSDFTSIGYIANSAVLPIKLSLVNCGIDSKTVDIAVKTNAVELQVNASQEMIGISPKTNCDNDVAVSLQPDIVHHLIHGNFPFRNLSILNLSNSITSFSGVQALSKCLQSCILLKKLNLSNCNIDDRGAMMLASSLKHCGSLESINFQDNFIPLSALKEILLSVRHCLLKIIAEDLTHQKEYRISNWDLLIYLKCCGRLQALDISLDREDMYRLGFKSEGWNQLKELRIVSLSPYNVDVKALSVNLSHFKNLHVLALKYFIYSTASVEILMTGLKQCPNLQILDLSDNKIGPKAAEEIVSRLVDFLNLRGLSLRNNHIGDYGANIVSSYAQHLSGLQELNLGNNSISSIGGKAVAANIHNFTELKMLDLQGNCIDDEAALEIAQNLERYCKNFNLSRNACCNLAKLQKIVEDKSFHFSIQFL